MSKMHNRSPLIWGGVFLLVGLFVILILKKFFPNTDLIGWVGVVGSYSSLYGLVVMLVQFQSVRSTAEATRDKINSVASVAELSHFAGLLRDASGDIERDSFELARYKIQAVKDVIISTFSIVKDSDKDLKNRADDCIIILNNHISSLNNVIIEEGVPVLNKAVIITDLESVCDFLQEVKNKQMNTI